MAPAMFSRRCALRNLLGITAGFAVGPLRADNDSVAPHLRLWSYGVLPSPRPRIDGFLIGGLSGLAWDDRTDLWYALTDDKGYNGPPARCYVLRLSGLRRGHALVPQGHSVVTLLDAEGQPFPRKAMDPEGLALRRDPRTGVATLLWSSEGAIHSGVPPAIYESTLDGRLLRQLQLPEHLRELGRWRHGPRSNRTLEGLAISADGRSLWASMEGALMQDRCLSGAAEVCRITRFDLDQGCADRQFAYALEPHPFGRFMPDGLQFNGIAALEVTPAGTLWVLERAFSPLAGFSVRLYEADPRGATDTLNIDSLCATLPQLAVKRLLLDMRQAGLPKVDNLEAMSWGPVLANGNRTLVLVSDDNYFRRQTTQFIVFEAMNL